MKWRGRRKSTRVDDRRHRATGSKSFRLGGGLVTVVIIVLMVVMGRNPLELLSAVDTSSTGVGSAYESTPEEDELVEFLGVVLADTEDVWDRLFNAEGRTYEAPSLVVFHDVVSSACGRATEAIGPFYCPGDDQIYIDLDFCHELTDRFQAPGDFAIAYVLAHEVGHHIQNLLGITDQMAEIRAKVSETAYNRYSVRLELQADFLAGVWAHHAQRMKQILDPGDIEEALQAANAIGDDTIQKRARGHVVPDSFTHGTSAQRIRWFKKGFETGDINQGDTFDTQDL